MSATPRTVVAVNDDRDQHPRSVTPWDPEFWDDEPGTDPRDEAAPPDPDAGGPTAGSVTTPEESAAATAARDTSWTKIVAVTVGACVVVGAVLWAVIPKGAPVKEEAAAQGSVAQDSRAEASDASQEVRRILSGERDRPTKAERLEARLGKPPKLSVQVFDPLDGTCPDVFNVTMVVRVIRGQFDDVVAEVRIPKDKYTRTRTLMYSDGDYTATLGGLPVNRTATLLVIGTGPQGEETTVTKDITHNCPGDPVDKDNPYDLVGEDAASAIEEKMFSDEYEFDFDMSGKP